MRVLKVSSQKMDLDQRRLRKLTDNQIEDVTKINNCLETQDWNKGMYDEFKLGYNFGKQRQ